MFLKWGLVHKLGNAGFWHWEVILAIRFVWIVSDRKLEICNSGPTSQVVI